MYVSRMGDVNEVFYEEIETPEACGEKCLVKIHAVRSAGTDKHAFMDGSMKGDIWGHEYSGEVVDPGSFEGLKVRRQGLRCFQIIHVINANFCKAGVTNLGPTVFRGTGAHLQRRISAGAPYSIKIDVNMTTMRCAH